MEIKFKETVTASGNIFRAEFKGFRLETDRATWLNVIVPDGGCEGCIIDADGDVIAESGECVTQKWTQADWATVTAAVSAKPSVVEWEKSVKENPPQRVTDFTEPRIALPWRVKNHANAWFEVLDRNGVLQVKYYGAEQAHALVNTINKFADLMNAFKAAQCDCTPRERDSGHKCGCWFPALESAIARFE